MLVNQGKKLVRNGNLVLFKKKNIKIIELYIFGKVISLIFETQIYTYLYKRLLCIRDTTRFFNEVANF